MRCRLDPGLGRLESQPQRRFLVAGLAQLVGDRFKEAADVLGVVAAEARRKRHPRNGVGAKARRLTFVTFRWHCSDRTA